ncbi:MAG: GGDEF domain-containing protein [Erythrobacter sp.]
MAGNHSGGEAAFFAIDPAAGLVSAIALALGLTVLALLRQPMAHAPLGRAGGSIEALFDRRRFERACRPAGPHAESPLRRTAVLEARVERLDVPGPVMGRRAREEARQAVARVMRAGLRRTDELRTIRGDGFVIVLDDAREADAAGVARRLRRALADARIPGVGGPIRVAARFGVAEGRSGESIAATRERAASALEAAHRAGEDCVVTAREIEEVLFLPPPAPGRDTATMKAA